MRGWPTIRSQPFRGIPPPPLPSAFRATIARSAHHVPRHARRAPSRASRERGPGALMRRARGRVVRMCGRASRHRPCQRLDGPTLPALPALDRGRPGHRARRARPPGAERPVPSGVEASASVRRFVPVPGRVPGATLATARPLANRGALDRGSMFRAREKTSVKMPEIAQDRRSASSAYPYGLKGSRSHSEAFRAVCQCVDVDADRGPKPLILLRLPLACS